MQARFQPLDHMGDSSGSSGRLHVSPHGAHVDQVERKVGKDFVDYEDDEHEYEALPSGYGWGVNMAAGAMVSTLLDRCLDRARRSTSASRLY